MADRGLIHYQPLTGPVWREPVAAALAWLPRGEPARPPERRILGDSVYPPFYELYQPAGLHWLPSGRWPIIPEIRKLGDFQQPPFQALYKPEQLGWMSPAYYVGRPAPRGTLDATVFPVQFAAPAFDPQHLEWIPSGTPPRTVAEVREASDLVQPAFDALYKPEGLQWLFEGQLSVRGIPYTPQSSWIVDPKPVVTVAFDPQFFPFQATDLNLARTLHATLQSDFATPPLPPGPDVIPPPAGGAPGMLLTEAGRRSTEERAQRQLVISKKYLETILGEEASEEQFIESVTEQILEAEKPSQPDLSREIGLLSALDAVTHAYNVHFETLGAARAAITGRLVELEEEDMMAVMMILAMADEL